MATKCTRSMTCRCPDCSAAMQMFTAKDLVAVASSKVDFTTDEQEEALKQQPSTIKSIKEDTSAKTTGTATTSSENETVIEKKAKAPSKPGLPSLAERQKMMKEKQLAAAAEAKNDVEILIAAPVFKQEPVLSVFVNGTAAASAIDDTLQSAHFTMNEPKVASPANIREAFSKPQISSSIIGSSQESLPSFGVNTAASSDEEGIVIEKWPKQQVLATVNNGDSAVKPASVEFRSPRQALLVPAPTIDDAPALIGSTDAVVANMTSIEAGSSEDATAKAMIRRRRTGPRSSKFQNPEMVIEKENDISGTGATSKGIDDDEAIVLDGRNEEPFPVMEEEKQQESLVTTDPADGELIRVSSPVLVMRDDDAKKPVEHLVANVKRSQDEAVMETLDIISKPIRKLPSAATFRKKSIQEEEEEEVSRMSRMGQSVKPSDHQKLILKAVPATEDVVIDDKPEETDYSSMPLFDRLASTDWKARKHGYEEIVKNASTPSGANTSIVNTIEAGLNTEAHAAALDAVLDAAIALVKNGHADTSGGGDDAVSRASRWIPALSKRCFAGRPSTRQRAIDLVLELFSVDPPKLVAIALVSELTSKNAKNVVACLTCMKDACAQFGAGKVVPAAQIVAAVETTMVAIQPAIRAESSALAVEAICWLGDAFKVLLVSKLAAEVQKKELERKIKDASDANGGSLPPRTPTRIRRDEQQQQQQNLASSSGNGGRGVPATSASVGYSSTDGDDMFDLLTTHDVLGKVEKPIDLEKRLKAAKWSDRKDVLAEVETACGKPPKLGPGDYSALVQILKKVVVNDTHQAVIIQALQVLVALSEGLRSLFAPYARGTLTPLLEKLRDQKRPITAAVEQVLDSYAHFSFSLADERIVTLISDALSNAKATPTQIRHIMAWIQRNCSNGRVVHWAQANQDLTALHTVVKTKAGHPDPAIRSAVNACLEAMKPPSGGAGSSNFAAVDPPSVVVPVIASAAVSAPVVSSSAARSATQASAAPAVRKNSLNSASAPSSSKHVVVSSAYGQQPRRPATAVVGEGTVSRSASTAIATRKPSVDMTPSISTSSGPTSSTATSGVAANTPVPVQFEGILDLLITWNAALRPALHLEKNSIRPEERANLIQAVLHALKSSPPNFEWKPSQLEQITQFVGSKTRDYHDPNQAVMQAAYDVACWAISRLPSRSTYIENTMVNSAASKLSDRKMNPLASQVLLAMAEGFHGPAWIICRLLYSSRSLTNPKSKSAILDFAAACVVDFGIDQLYWVTGVSSSLGMVKPPMGETLSFDDFLHVVCTEDGVGSNSLEVRSSAVCLLGEFCKQLGVTRFQRLNHIPASISLECQRRAAGSHLLAPNRTWRYLGVNTNGGQFTNFVGAGVDGGIQDDEPVDLSGDIDQVLPILQTSDAPSWKKREDALMQVERLLTPKRPVIFTRSSKELAAVLGKRLDDTQRNLAAKAAVCIGLLAECTGGTYTPQLIKCFGERLVISLGDSKKAISSACQTSMTLCVCHSGKIQTACFAVMLQYCVEPLKLGKVDRVRLLQWIGDRLEERSEQDPNGQQQESDPQQQHQHNEMLRLVYLDLISPLIACFTAREAPARKLAVKCAELVAGYLPANISNTRFKSGIRDLKGAEQRTVGPMIEEVLEASKRYRVSYGLQNQSHVTTATEAQDDSLMMTGSRPVEEISIAHRYAQQQQYHLSAPAGAAVGLQSADRAFPQTPPRLQEEEEFELRMSRGGIEATPLSVARNGQQYPLEQEQKEPYFEAPHHVSLASTPMMMATPQNSVKAMAGLPEAPFEEEDTYESTLFQDDQSFERLVEYWNAETEECRARLKEEVEVCLSSDLARALFSSNSGSHEAFQLLETYHLAIEQNPTPLLLWSTIFFTQPDTFYPFLTSLCHFLYRTLLGSADKVKFNDFEAEAFLPYLLNRFTQPLPVTTGLGQVEQLKLKLTQVLDSFGLCYRADRFIRFLTRYASTDKMDEEISLQCLLGIGRIMEKQSDVEWLRDDREVISSLNRCLSSPNFRISEATNLIVRTIYVKTGGDGELMQTWFGWTNPSTPSIARVSAQPQQPETPPSPSPSKVMNRSQQQQHQALNQSSVSATFASLGEKTLKTMMKDVVEYSSSLAQSSSALSSNSPPRISGTGNRDALMYSRCENALKFLNQHLDQNPRATGPEMAVLSDLDDLEWIRMVEETFDTILIVKSLSAIVDQLALRGGTAAGIGATGSSAWRKTSWMVHLSRMCLQLSQTIFTKKALAAQLDSATVQLYCESLLALHSRIKVASGPVELLEQIEKVFFGPLTETPFWLPEVLTFRHDPPEFVLLGLKRYVQEQEQKHDLPPFYCVDVDECLKLAKKSTWVPTEVIRSLESLIVDSNNSTVNDANGMETEPVVSLLSPAAIQAAMIASNSPHAKPPTPNSMFQQEVEAEASLQQPNEDEDLTQVLLSHVHGIQQARKAQDSEEVVRDAIHRLVDFKRANRHHFAAMEPGFVESMFTDESVLFLSYIKGKLDEVDEEPNNPTPSSSFAATASPEIRRSLNRLIKLAGIAESLDNQVEVDDAGETT